MKSEGCVKALGSACVCVYMAKCVLLYTARNDRFVGVFVKAMRFYASPSVSTVMVQ